MRKKVFSLSLEPPLSHFFLQKTIKSKNFLVRYFILGKWLLTSFLVSKFIKWARFVVLTRPQSSLTKTTGDESGSSQSLVP